MQVSPENQKKLSIVVPCFNEEQTLERCLQNALGIQDESLSLEIIIVDDCSTDNSLKIAETLAEKHAEVTVLRHDRNRGKGAALQTGSGRTYEEGKKIGYRDGFRALYCIFHYNARKAPDPGQEP